jgi:hypothetical protein
MEVCMAQVIVVLTTDMAMEEEEDMEAIIAMEDTDRHMVAMEVRIHPTIDLEAMDTIVSEEEEACLAKGPTITA